jgi:hypothetical protein
MGRLRGFQKKGKMQIINTMPVAIRPSRWLIAISIDGRVVAQKVPDDAVIISRKDLPPGWA